ncbi:hypothetical protein [Acidovorax sp. CCYZU-2555]|uniref:hypothetical protein n=1 Tax=Acidovorax sp. CCYZU-2555 TaxID=2835042 RepID=UPI001BD17B06|nr:hypothetical protein [Acidovorax sp. CCYZU-2555]MBS7777623.1 hypothetical protein [Acidovorax sp. CCYZU-2555]
MTKPQTPQKTPTPTDTIDAPRSVDTTEREDGEPSDAPKLPHERDESVDMTHGAPSEKMRQAHADVVSGQKDTDARNTEARRLDPKNNPNAA